MFTYWIESCDIRDLICLFWKKKRYFVTANSVTGVMSFFLFSFYPLFHFVAPGGVYVDPWCAYKTYTNPKDKRSHSTSLLNLFCIGSTLLHWEFFFFPYKQKLKAICAQMAHPAINMWHLAFFMIARCSLVSFYIDSLPTIILDQQFDHS